MNRIITGVLGLASAAALIAACSADSSQLSDDEGPSNNGGAGTGGTDFNPNNTGGSGAGVITDPPCDNAPELDGDGDGWTGAQGDCNDCTNLMNPGALDYAGNNIDEDCNGVDDDTVLTCDDALAIDSQDGLDGAGEGDRLGHITKALIDHVDVVLEGIHGHGLEILFGRADHFCEESGPAAAKDVD